MTACPEHLRPILTSLEKSDAAIAKAKARAQEPASPPAATAPGLDWRDGAHASGREKPCVHCAGLTYLRDDTRRPAHKTCVETVVTA